MLTTVNDVLTKWILSQSEATSNELTTYARARTHQNTDDDVEILNILEFIVEGVCEKLRISPCAPGGIRTYD